MDKTHIIFLILAISLVAISAMTVIRQRAGLTTALSLKPTISPSSTPISTATPTASPTDTPNSIIVKFATNNPTPSPTNSPQPTTNNSNSDWRYPNSTGNDSTFTSSDSPDTITNWYKDKIRSLGLNTTTFVTTNSNNNVLNKLAAAGKGTSLAIEIKRSSGDSLTTITISR